MSFKKVTLASLILLGLTACGSSGGGNSDSVNQSASNASITAIEAKLAEAEKALEELKATNQTNATALAKANANLAEAQENLKKLQNDKNATEAQLTDAQNKLKEAEANQAQITSELNKQSTEKNAQIAQLNQELEALKATHQTNITALAKANENLAEAQENLKKLQNDKNATEAQLTDAQNKLREAEANQARITSELNTQLAEKNAQITQLNNEVKAIEADLSTANTNLAKAQEDLNAVQNDKTKTESELTAAQTKLQEAQAAKETAENKLAAKQRVIEAIHSQILQLENRYNNVGYKDPSEYAMGFHKNAYIHISPAVENVGDGVFTADQYIYKQQYSTVIARATKDSSMSDDITSPRFRVNQVWTESATTNDALPTEGSATYIGKAFHADHLGNLTYNVDFSERSGSGKLSGFSQFSDITLEKGNIETIKMDLNYNNTDTLGIASNASMADGTTGKYVVGFFGPNAEEVAGEVYMFKHLDGSFKSNGSTAKKYGFAPERGTMFGFGGTRGEIQK